MKLQKNTIPFSQPQNENDLVCADWLLLQLLRPEVEVKGLIAAQSTEIYVELRQKEQLEMPPHKKVPGSYMWLWPHLDLAASVFRSCENAAR